MRGYPSHAKLLSATSRAVSVFFAHIWGSLPCLNLFTLVRIFCFFIHCYPSFVTVIHIVCISTNPSTLTTDSLGCQELTVPTDREGKIQPSGSIVNIRRHWSLTLLAMPITFCDNKNRIYAPSGPSYIATVATGCCTSLAS